MIIEMKPDVAPDEVEQVRAQVADLGYDPRVIHGPGRPVIGTASRDPSRRSLKTLRDMAPVQTVLPITKRYKLASREFRAQDTAVNIAGRRLGAGSFQIIAGPCAVENRAQMRAAARDLVAAGVGLLRGGAYKPRTSPYDFQGLGEAGLELLAEVKAEFGVAVVTEVVGAPQIDRIARVADVLQIGARNSQNYYLLEMVADAGLPVLLKRGLAATVEEWLCAAEYLLVHGCRDVILCERGVRTFETATRNTLDISAVAIAKAETHLPVIVDPSHAAGSRALVAPLAKAAIAAGADGLLIEAHPDPAAALCDAAQQLPTGDLPRLIAEWRPFVEAAGKRVD